MNLSMQSGVPARHITQSDVKVLGYHIVSSYHSCRAHLEETIHRISHFESWRFESLLPSMIVCTKE